MEITRNGPASPGDPRRRADEARVENLVNVRSRAIAAREELERYRELLAEKTRVQRQGAARAEERSAQRVEREERAERPDARGDRIDLSERSRRLANAAERDGRGIDELAERVRRLAALERDGQLASPERLDRAARRMLGDAG